FLRLLKPGGRAAVIVPDGVLFGSSNAHKTLRKILVEDQKLEAVISLPSGVFKPYAGVSTAILLFTKTNSGGTEHVWFYDVHADVPHRPPGGILKALGQLDAEIQQGMKQLKGMLR